MKLRKKNIYFPRLCVPLKNEQIKEIAWGYRHSWAVTSEGNLFTWGSNEQF